jgi:hypothetical protein
VIEQCENERTKTCTDVRMQASVEEALATLEASELGEGDRRPTAEAVAYRSGKSAKSGYFSLKSVKNSGFLRILLNYSTI